ncbi:Uracil-DNA glycosylase [Methylobacillus rhizosphaerae]|uniref:Uracil-DNA glycosylase n=1 Tax=Methylobacillus rhizosphaerae TaxID=551994 RepID=A0A238ZAH7_9PROT|nr:uracil-DNA glycosylase [Methylobacillus rhizosphaerae]SNR80545.1 Uracil-DNA glycosylase [Methylobacillus rhizosphaerae]
MSDPAIQLHQESLPAAWAAAIPELQTQYDSIKTKLDMETDIRPRRGLWFEALRQVDPAAVRVVLLGQDPYHGEDHGIQQAHGLSFSVPEGVRPPPSLRNMLKEMQADIGQSRSSGNLMPWARQGVLLLNASLTTRGGIAGAHSKIWPAFTHALLHDLGQRELPLVFILWGAHAQQFRSLIAPHHIVISAAHPSPLSAYRGFFGSKPYSKTNAALHSIGLPEIDWSAAQ